MSHPALEVFEAPPSTTSSLAEAAAALSPPFPADGRGRFFPEELRFLAKRVDITHFSSRDQGECVSGAREAEGCVAIA